MPTSIKKRKRRSRPSSTSSTAVAVAVAVARSRQQSADDDNDILDLCSNSSANNDDDDDDDTHNRPQYSGYKSLSFGDSAMNDTKLRGTHKLITLESAQYAIRLVAEFMRDDERGESITFKRALFDPLWQRLKDQGCGKNNSNNNSNSSSSPPSGGRSSSSRNSCCWRYESIRDPLSTRNWAFLPPRSTLGTKGGTLGKDYYLSEEQVALGVLEDISTLEELSDLFAKNAHYFTSVIPILDKAVQENIEYKFAARRDDVGDDDGMADGTSNSNRMSTRSVSSRSCNLHSFGIDCALAADPCELSSGEEEEEEDDEKSTSAGGDDENEDHCDICGKGGELICCEGCENAYHANCLQVDPDSLPDSWYCSSCAKRGYGKKQKSENNASSQQTECLKKCDGKTVPPKSANENKDECDICGDGGELLCCDGCVKAYHTTCLGVDPDSLSDPWYCSSCVEINTASDNDNHCADITQSNLLGVAPKVNMPVEIIDTDSVWNMARITHVSYEGKPECHVTVCYEGWGPTWNEELPYPNERLARVFTYTKKVKCFVLLNGARKKDMCGKGGTDSSTNIRNWTDIWPCTVSFRMPHPGSSHATDHLRGETYVFAELYKPHLLPPEVQQQITFGGQWISENRLRSWKDLNVRDPATPSTGDCVLYEIGNQHAGKAYDVSGNFRQAYQMAQSDWMHGKLHLKAPLEEGALLKEEYRVCNAGGDDGVRYTGSFPNQKQEESIPPTLQSSENLPHLPASKVPFVHPPTLPPPIPITDMAYPNQGVRRLPSNRWSSVLRVAGNDLFLGSSYASQSEAAYAVKIASEQQNVENIQGAAGIANGQISAASLGNAIRSHHLPHIISNFGDSPLFVANAGQTADLLNTPIESIVSAFEDSQPTSDENSQSQPPFRLQDWLAQHHIQHSGQNVSKNFALCVDIKNDQDVREKKRKKCIPKRLHKLTLTGNQESKNSAGVSS